MNGIKNCVQYILRTKYRIVKFWLKKSNANQELGFYLTTKTQSTTLRNHKGKKLFQPLIRISSLS
ncbi:MAG: hypothetical protein DRI83_02540 [Bacteroidetes bacterium]|nr:MAG: hypothetical protein DRI83_02540 [Bacteroidota bacterium]